MRDINSGLWALAVAIVFVALGGAWFFRYETIGNGPFHRNRFTGNTCHFEQSCWFCNGLEECSNRR